MNTLIINGSPRKNGDTVSLINEIVQNLEGKVYIVSTYYDDIAPCIDCRYCWTHPKCAINDNMQELYNLLNEVDNVIIASPLYFSELTGSLLNFASRLQFFYVSRCIREDKDFQLKPKNGVLVLVAGGDTRDLSKALGTANTLFKHIGVKAIENVFSLHTDSVGGAKGTRAKDDKDALRTARKVAFQLNELNT